MSKKRRNSKANEQAGESTGGQASTTGKSSRHSSSSSSGDGPGLIQRYRNVLIGALVVVGVGFIGLVIFQNSTAAAYTCDSLLEAPPSETSGDGAERLGFAVPDAGREHQGGRLRYATCPPTSGDHRAGGALDRQYYGPGTVQVPNDWVHNLEHGYAIIAYAGEPGAETIAEIRTAMDAPAPTDVAVQCGLPNKVIALRFDDMAEPFAVLAWDRALLMETFDTELATAAAEEFQDQPQAPERAC